MYKRLITNFLFFSLVWAECIAQSKVTISGTIKDVNGEPIFAAAVMFKNKPTGTYTDEQGRYILKVKSQKGILVVSMLGYETQEIEVDTETDRHMDFILKESPTQLETVQIYGKSQVQKIKESAFTTSALNIKEQINSLHNINAIVNRTTGIRVREEGGVGSDFELSINGMSGNSVRYFIDGIPLSSKGSDVNLANLPVSIIDRIEIYKGIVPSQLGADALGGAVNIITKEEKKNYLDVSYGVGSFHTHKLDFNSQFVEKKSGLIIRPSLGINYSKNDYKMKEVEIWDDASSKYVITQRKRFHDDYFSLLGQVEAGFVNKPWTDAFYVYASYSKADKDIQTGSIQSKVYGEAKRELDAWSIGMRYQKESFLLDKLHFAASLSHTWDHSITVDSVFRKYDWNGDYIEASRNEITGRERSVRHYERPLTVVRVNIDYPLNGYHSFNLNYLLNRTGNDRYDDIDSDFEPTNDVLAKHNIGLSYTQSFLDDKMNNVFFLKNYINHLEIEQQDLYWLTGSKEIPSSSTKNHWGYGAATRYRLMDQLAIKLSYEHSVRLPLARELLGNGTTVTPNVKLNPETSENVNVGLFGTIRWNGENQLSYEANGFVRDASNYIRAVISEQDGLLQYENVASVKIKGIEGEVIYNYGNLLHAGINCSYQDARNMKKTLESGKPSITYKNKMPNRPWLFGNTEFELYFHNIFSKKDKIRIGYNYQYVHWYYLTWEAYGSLDGKAKIPTQHQHNAVISYSWKNGKYNLSLECNDLYDKILYDNYMLQKPGRSFFCKFRLFIN